MITYQPKTFENPNIVDIKPVIAEHPKTSYKLCKTIKKGEKVGFNRSLNSDTKTFFERKEYIKITNGTMILKAMQLLILLKF